MSDLSQRLRVEAVDWEGLTRFDPKGEPAKQEAKLVGLLREAADEIERLRKSLGRVERVLTVPAAEYVPAIGDAFEVIREGLRG